MILDSRASLSAKQLPPDHPKADPPAYNDIEHYSVDQHVAGSVRSSSRSSPSHQHIQSFPVNGLHLAKRKEDLTGRYRLDPCLPVSDAHHHPKHWREIPNISFQTRHGAIRVELATACQHGDQSRASAKMISCTGDITVLLAESFASQTINVDVSSKKGDVALMVPRNFCGVIQLHTKRGTLDIMPALSKIVKIVKETDTEILLMVGNTQAPASSGASTADYCQLHSRFGKVSVGMRGEDKLLPREPGVWKKMAMYLGMHSNESSQTLTSTI